MIGFSGVESPSIISASPSPEESSLGGSDSCSGSLGSVSPKFSFDLLRGLGSQYLETSWNKSRKDSSLAEGQSKEVLVEFQNLSKQGTVLLIPFLLEKTDY